MNYNVRRFRQHLFCAIRDPHVPRSIRRPGDFPEVLANLGGIGVNRADDLDGLFFTHQACDGSADGPDTVLDGPNLLLHVDLRNACGWRVRGSQSVRPRSQGVPRRSESITIEEFSPPFNRIPRRSCSPPHLPVRAGTRIMSPMPSSKSRPPGTGVVLLGLAGGMLRCAQKSWASRKSQAA